MFGRLNTCQSVLLCLRLCTATALYAFDFNRTFPLAAIFSITKLRTSLVIPSSCLCHLSLLLFLNLRIFNKLTNWPLTLLLLFLRLLHRCFLLSCHLGRHLYILLLLLVDWGDSEWSLAWVNRWRSQQRSLLLFFWLHLWLWLLLGYLLHYLLLCWL